MKFSLVKSILLCTSMMGMSASTVAQQDSDSSNGGGDEIDNEIIVIGTSFKDALRKSLNIKKQADGIVDAIGAEDIGKLPDVSVADTIARLPGVTAERGAAGAGRVSLRGMGYQLANGTLNGREIASAFGDRGVSLALFPPELISGAGVYKTPTASQIEGGVAGIINLQTLRPLDQGERSLSFNLRGRYNDLIEDTPYGDAYGYRTSGIYVDQFMEHTLGVVFGYAYSDSPFVSVDSEIFNPQIVSFAGRSIPGLWSIPPFDPSSGYDLPGVFDNTGQEVQDAFNIPFGAGWASLSGESDRHNILFATQWQPNENLEVNFDSFYSKFESESFGVGMLADIRGGGFGTEFSNIVVDEYNVTSATIDCVICYYELVGLNIKDASKNEVSSFGLNVDWSDEFVRVSGDIAYSKAEEEQFYGAIKTGDGQEVGSASNSRQGFTFGENENGAAFLISDADFADPNTNLLNSLRVADDDVTTDEMFSAKVDAEFHFDTSFLNRIKTGIRHVNRSNNREARNGTLLPSTNLTVNDLNNIDISEVEQNLQSLVDITRGSYSLEQASSDFTAQEVLLLDFDSVVADRFNNERLAPNPALSPKLDEQTFAVYTQIDFATDALGFETTGNLGVRWVRTKIDSFGVEQLDGEFVSNVNVSNEFTDTLPALNVALHFTDKTQLRLALAKALARPIVSYLQPGRDSYTRPRGGRSDYSETGNPLLEPYRTTQADIALEHYFDSDTAVTLSLFYKDLDTFITNRRFDEFLEGNRNAQTFLPVNGDGGYIRGAELLVQYAFTDWVPEGFGDLGIYANYSYTESNVRISENDTPGTNLGTFGLDGLSRDVYNITLWHSLGKVDSRVSYRYRDPYSLLARPGAALVNNNEEEDLSFQISFNPTEQWNFVLSGWNLTDKERDRTFARETQQAQYRLFGRNLEFGVTYKFL